MRLSIDNKKTTNIVYNSFFINSKLDAKTERTFWNGTHSYNSFCFINADDGNSDAVCKKLIEVFDINDVKIFQEKFKMAISGDGQELKRIAVLHSSSLAALLMFYSVNKEKPIEIEIEGKKYVFTKSYFEVKTQVKGGHYSNMDVVLVGKEKDNDVLFFLESKFSEYLNTGMCNGVSLDTYKEKYDELGLLSETCVIRPLSFAEGVKDGIKCLQISPKGNGYYCHGIKQMISHFMGVSEFAKRGKEAMDSRQSCSEFYTELPKLLEKENTKILLGEVLFRFDDKVDKKDRSNKNRLEKYKDIYSDLAKVLKKYVDNMDSNVIVLSDVLIYQDLLVKFKLDRNVILFYQF